MSVPHSPQEPAIEPAGSQHEEAPGVATPGVATP